MFTKMEQEGYRKKYKKHYELKPHSERHLPATSLKVEHWNGKLTITAIYCPPNVGILKDDFEEFFNTLAQKLTVDGDFNAK